MWELLNVDADDKKYLKLMFHFYDYDNNANIAAVDIINLRKHFDLMYLENNMK